jgi:hypothetical protein
MAISGILMQSIAKKNFCIAKIVTRYKFNHFFVRVTKQINLSLIMGIFYLGHHFVNIC